MLEHLKKNLLQIQYLNGYEGPKPEYKSKLASGFDLLAQLENTQSIQLKPLERCLVKTKMIFEIDPGYEVQIRTRSGLALKKGLVVLNSPGTIDADYRGEIGVILINLSEGIVEIANNERIAQAVVCPIVQTTLTEITETSTTERGSGGFGSTGV